MFSIFSMRRPNILPVGECGEVCVSYSTFIHVVPLADLGVQRGVLRWFLSLHSPTYKVNVSPNKVKSPEEKKTEAKAKKGKAKADEDALPVFGETTGQPDDAVDDVSSVPPGPVSASPLNGSGNTEETELASMPAPFTPSINKTLNTVKKGFNPPPLPDGLNAAILKSRLDPKKKVK
jgi:DNA-3-methyladenine glycosylase II